MVKYACDKCGKEIGIESPRYIIRMQDANHKGRMDRVICLCHPCMDQLVDDAPWLLQIGYVKKDKEAS